MKLPDFPQEGGCLCGDVRYSLLEDPIALHACHCPNCQTRTGSAFGMTMITQRKSVKVLEGEPGLYSFTTRDGLAKRTRCCPNCATCVWGEVGDTGLIALQPGTLDDTAWLQPIGHIFASCAQPWIEVPKDVLRFERQPEDELELVRAWKSRGSDVA